MDVRDITIDEAYIAQRKAVFKEKMEAVLHYAEAQNCRSRMLLSYFDEPDAAPCGICDYCADERRRLNTTDLSDWMVNEMVQLLDAGAMSLADLISSMRHGNEKQRLDTLRMLLDAGKIKTDGERFYL